LALRAALLENRRVFRNREAKKKKEEEEEEEEERKQGC